MKIPCVRLYNSIAIHSIETIFSFFLNYVVRFQKTKSTIVFLISARSIKRQSIVHSSMALWLWILRLFVSLSLASRYGTIVSSNVSFANIDITVDTTAKVAAASIAVVVAVG